MAYGDAEEVACSVPAKVSETHFLLELDSTPLDELQLRFRHASAAVMFAPDGITNAGGPGVADGKSYRLAKANV